MANLSEVEVVVMVWEQVLEKWRLGLPGGWRMMASRGKLASASQQMVNLLGVEVVVMVLE